MPIKIRNHRCVACDLVLPTSATAQARVVGALEVLSALCGGEAEEVETADREGGRFVVGGVVGLRVLQGGGVGGEEGFGG